MAQALLVELRVMRLELEAVRTDDREMRAECRGWRRYPPTDRVVDIGAGLLTRLVVRSEGWLKRVMDLQFWTVSVLSWKDET